MAMFEDLGAWEPTRATLHAILQVLAAVPRRFSPHHERWWHIGFQVQAGDLRLQPVALPDGSALDLGLRLREPAAFAETDSGLRWSWPLGAGTGPEALADELFSAAARLGLAGLDPAKFSDLGSLGYDPAHARRFFDLVLLNDRIFNAHREHLAGETGGVHLWPHGFDMSVEWFGTRRIEQASDGKVKTAPAQLNLGWSPGEESHPAPYYYSNPWPFDPALTRHPLPSGASWMDGAWKGSILPYRELVGDPHGEARLREYARAVFELASPSLMA